MAIKKIIRSDSLTRLADFFREFDTSAELMDAEYEDRSLRGGYFFTSNFAMYAVEDGKVFLYFGGRKANPILDNLEEACRQLDNGDNYRPGGKDIAYVVESVSSGDTVKVDMSKLNLKIENDDHKYFEINTKNYDKLNKTQRVFAEKVYGEGEDFIRNMKMLRESYPNLKNISIYVLNPRYVKDNVEDGKAISRACWFDFFSCVFYAFGVDIGGICTVRGIPKITQENTKN